MTGHNTAADANGSDPRRLLLSTDLASRGQKRLALVVAVVAVLAFAVAVPFVRVPLAKMPAFIPSYEAALFFIDLVTAILLFDQFMRVRSAGLLFLASGYLFDALIIVAHALSFPGAFSTTGLLGAGPQTTAWLYVFWHGGFSLFVICYALWGRWEDANGSVLSPDRIRPAIIASVAAVAALTFLLVLISTWGHDWLPAVMQGSDYSMLVTKGISPAVWLLTLIAMVLLYRRAQRVMDLWLMLVMWIWLFDIGLSAVIGSTRFDLGFYAGRIFGLIASAFLLVALVIETIQLYSRALGAASSAEQKLAQLKRAEVAPEVKRAGSKSGEPVEQFVRRQNIERYRAMLKSQSLDAVQRQTIEKLLNEEETKYREG
jgi:hypothetical protein